jgi:hypothetical protein
LYLWPLRADFESREITDSRKFWSKKIVYSEIGGHVLTPFFWKNRSKRDKEKHPMKTVVNTKNWYREETDM